MIHNDRALRRIVWLLRSVVGNSRRATVPSVTRPSVGSAGRSTGRRPRVPTGEKEIPGEKKTLARKRSVRKQIGPGGGG
ncbi:hypothetical protein L596_002948 [Steinernema carpocapsae]|uniref:Uncharacterized protein n=1 Tax=Steinernema carpocapsae TaxID=34508 RepID=A0A4U8UQN6_STECR|nr:hypothetical protein L596_002948 [Steinernema carpocapsae]